MRNLRRQIMEDRSAKWSQCKKVLKAMTFESTKTHEHTRIAGVQVCACLVLSVSSSSWCLGRATACDCGTPWTFLLPFMPSQIY